MMNKATPIIITNWITTTSSKLHLTGQHANYWSHSRIITNFETGRTSVEDLVRRLTFLMKPLWSGYTSLTLPSNQEPRGALESTTRTTSPTCTFPEGNNHFCRSWSSGRYLRVHRFQKRSLRYWICLQREGHNYHTQWKCLEADSIDPSGGADGWVSSMWGH